MLKILDDVLAQAQYSMVLGTHNENDGILLQREYAVIYVATNPSPTETIGIGTKTYTFVASGATGDQINVGLTAAATILNIKAKINADYLATGCRAYSLGLGTLLALVSNSDSTHPTFTPDGVKVVLDTDWTVDIAESRVENENYFKVPLTDANAKPVVLVERNSGTYQNFLY